MTRSHDVDMSAEAIDLRLLELAQLYRLGVSIELGARRLGSVVEASPDVDRGARREEDARPDLYASG
jgi:hypothetical protein